TISDILNEKDKWLSINPESSDATKKKRRSLIYEEVDQALTIWTEKAIGAELDIIVPSDSLLLLFEYLEDLENMPDGFDLKNYEMPKIVYSAIHALYRIFSQLLSKGGLQRPKETAEKDQQMIIKSELRDNYIRYINNLYGLIGQEEPGLQIPSLNILLDLLRIESIYYTKASGDFYFPNNQYYRIVEALIDNENFNEHLLNEF
ncbi:12601_t:CDS:2, partial [Entrophospora sp. SA101]